jgi:uncharacterized protein involved in cysteine biosynthesis
MNRPRHSRRKSTLRDFTFITLAVCGLATIACFAVGLVCRLPMPVAVALFAVALMTAIRSEGRYW